MTTNTAVSAIAERNMRNAETIRQIRAALASNDADEALVLFEQVQRDHPQDAQAVASGLTGLGGAT